MPFINCKRCGADIYVEEHATTATCGICQSEQVLPILHDDRVSRLRNRAEHLRVNGEFDKATAIYEEILAEESTDSSVYWDLVLCGYGIQYVVDPGTGRHVPTVNRAQFTAIYDDPNYKLAWKHGNSEQRRIYEEQAEEINAIHRGILSISEREEPFDIFICYKETDTTGERTEDSVQAEYLYDLLTGAGYKVFFARITLEDKLGSAYEPYIFAALNSAKVMVAIGTKPEHFNAVWVKNEWSRYLSLVKKSGGKKTLIPVYMGMSPYDLPEEFAHLQGQDLSKVGAKQDIVRGIKKLIPLQAPAAPVAAPTAPVANHASETAPLLRRAHMFLEDGEFAKADECCEQVLNREPENAEAYLVKLMVDLKIKTREALKTHAQPPESSRYYEKILRYAAPTLRREMVDCNESIKNRNEEAARQRAYKEAVAAMEAADSEGAYAQAAAMWERLADYRDARERARTCREKSIEVAARDAEAARRNAYNRAVDAMNAARTEEEFTRCAEDFRRMGNYADAAALAEDCVVRAEETRLNEIYDNAVNTSGEARTEASQGRYGNAIRLYSSAAMQFGQISTWKDAAQRRDQCKAKLPEMQELLREAEARASEVRAHEMQNLVREAKRKKRKKKIVLFVVLAIVVAVVLSVVGVVSSSVNQAKDEMASKYGKDAVVSLSILDMIYSVENGAVKGGGDLPKNLEIPHALVSVFGGTHEITSIAEYAFRSKDELRTVKIPNSVTAIGRSAFENCTGITSVSIPSSVVRMGNSAFKGCKSLTAITIPSSITDISERAFENCTSLTSVTIPVSVTRIHTFAFSGCSNLTRINYGGTMEQWKAVQKDLWCFDGTGNYTVHCTDGDLQ